MYYLWGIIVYLKECSLEICTFLILELKDFEVLFIVYIRQQWVDDTKVVTLAKTMWINLIILHLIWFYIILIWTIIRSTTSSTKAFSLSVELFVCNHWHDACMHNEWDSPNVWQRRYKVWTQMVQSVVIFMLHYDFDENLIRCFSLLDNDISIAISL